ncbi:MAG: response regulator, partial [Candidatus Neomarinimicrobiota bacterium]
MNIPQKSINLDLSNIFASESKILVVDDEESVVKLICFILKGEGYKTVTASGGDLALSKITKKSNFDLVILDIMMPGISGLEVCKKIRSKYNLFELPILFCSALADSENIARGLDLGANDYITKPLNKIELLARVRSLISLKQLYSIAHINERMATFRAHHDDLTGLPNRSFLQSILKDLITAKPTAEPNLVALILLDINRFRSINTSLGFVAGDIYLKEISQRILENVSPDDVVVRLHSNTFAIIKTGTKWENNGKKKIN